MLMAGCIDIHLPPWLAVIIVHHTKALDGTELLKLPPKLGSFIVDDFVFISEFFRRNKTRQGNEAGGREQ